MNSITYTDLVVHKRIIQKAALQFLEFMRELDQDETSAEDINDVILRTLDSLDISETQRAIVDAFFAMYLNLLATENRSTAAEFVQELIQDKVVH
jgi:hypothetical protein